MAEARHVRGVPARKRRKATVRRCKVSRDRLRDLQMLEMPHRWLRKAASKEWKSQEN